MATFTEKELEFIGSDGLGRLATLSADGAPAIAAVRYRVETDGDETLIVVPGFGMRHSAKFHNVKRDGRVSFLIDGGGGGGPHSVKFIQVRGVAESVDNNDDPRIVIHAKRIIAFNINEEYQADEAPQYDTREVGGERTLRRLVG
jgi:pyridoxamine 5'-phosphate oxidase family protein